MTKRILFVALALGAVLVPAHAQTVQKRTLPNGLRVLVRENPGSPVEAVRVYVKTGSIYEDKYLGAGLSHLFEHTLFEGTKTEPKKVLNDELQAIGGQSNAYTSYDVTAYHVTTAKDYFGRAVNVLADMMQNATFPEAEVKVQQGVIHNEMNLGEDDPDRALSQLWNATAFRVHPVRYPVIGFTEQFDALTRDDILSYYKSHYTPNNAVVSVAGGVPSDAAFAAIEKAFGDWKRGAPQTIALPSEPYQSAPRRATQEMAVNLTYLQMGWHTIPLQHPDLYALDALSQIFGGSESSRLPLDLLQRKNLVTSVSSYSQTPDYDGGVFAVNAVMPPANESKVENAIRAQVAALKSQGVTEAELARAKKQIRASFILSNQDVENQAEMAAYDELGTGDPNYSRRYLDNIDAVSVAAVNAVARKYLRDDGLTVAVVQPKTTGAAVAKPVAQPHQSAAALAPKVIKLANGLRLIVSENNSAPTVAISLMGLGGVRAETPKKAGVASLTAQLLTAGTTQHSAEQIASTIDDMGAEMSGYSGYNAWGIDSQWLASDWNKGLNLIGEVVKTSTFPSDEIAKSKTQMLAGIAAQGDDPQSSASLLVRRLFYGSHPYSRSTLGTAETVKGLTRSDVEAYWKQVLQPKNMVISVQGAVKAAEVEKSVNALFAGMKASGPAFTPPAAVVPPAQLATKTVDKAGIVQAAMWYGFPSIKIQNEDRYAIDVLDAALSGADLPGGRLHERLRNAELVYVVHAYDSPGLDGGMFVIYAASTRANRPKAQTIIEEEVAKVRDADITPEELERAKTMMISAHAIDLQTNTAGARSKASNELFGLGVNSDASYSAKIGAITLADVRRVAQKYLVPEHSALAIVEPKE